MGKALFITGTDTGVGKSFVTCGLLEVLLKKGIKTSVVKPFATGGRWIGDSLVSPDAESYAAHLPGNYGPRELEDLCFYSWESPLAPLAAQLKGEDPQNIDWKKIEFRLKEMKSQNQVLLIEGIGGVAVPLCKDKLACDLALAAQAPALVVSENKLGCINHTYLSLNFLQSRGIEVFGFVFNEVNQSQHDPSQISNGDIIQTLSGAPYLGHLPHGTPIRSLFGDIAQKLGLLD